MPKFRSFSALLFLAVPASQSRVLCPLRMARRLLPRLRFQVRFRTPPGPGCQTPMSP